MISPHRRVNWPKLPKSKLPADLGRRRDASSMADTEAGGATHGDPQAVHQPVSEFDRFLAEQRQLLGDAERSRDQFAARRRAIDRSKIALFIVYVFSAYLLILLVFVGIGSTFGRDWSQAAEFLLEVLKVVLLPILTLVLGYYFGSRDQ